MSVISLIDHQEVAGATAAPVCVIFSAVMVVAAGKVIVRFVEPVPVSAGLNAVKVVPSLAEYSALYARM